MGDVNALVVFYSRRGTAERLALAAGLGAIQADANIRLRRVADRADSATIEADAEWKTNLARMNRDYVVPRPADPVWADVIILATPAEPLTESKPTSRRWRRSGRWPASSPRHWRPGKRETALRPVNRPRRAAGSSSRRASAADDDPIATATTFGQRVTEMARALKNRD